MFNRDARNPLNSGWVTILGNTTWGSVVEHTSSILDTTMVWMYPRKFSSLSALYTSIQPQRLPGHGISLLTPFMEMAGTSPTMSESFTIFDVLNTRF